MSLNFDLSKISSFKTVCYDGEQMKPITEALIYASMSVGLGEVTAKNVDEWLVRLSLTDRLFGTFLRNGDGQRSFTRQEIEAHIGLVCNVRSEKRASWAKRMMDNFFQEAMYQQRRQQEGKGNGK